MIILTEIKKILSMPALWGFMALVMIFNIFLAASFSYSDEIDYINAVNTVAGEKYGKDYTERISAIIPPDDEKDFLKSSTHASLVSAAESFSGGLHGEELMQEFNSFSGGEYIQKSPFANRLLTILKSKYDRILAAVDKKNASGESSAVAFGELTGSVFQYSVGTLGRAMLVECILLASLIVLFSLSYEKLASSELLIYSTKKGRKKLAGAKIAASLAVSCAVFAAVFAVGFGVFFARNDFSLAWDAPISTVFNSAELVSSVRIIAWDSLTFGEFYVCMGLLGFLLMLIFFFFSASLGLVMSNTYAAFGITAFTAVFNVVIILAPLAMPALKYFCYMLPSGIAFSIPVWFQYGGTDILLPYQETICAAFWSSAAAGLFFGAFRCFLNKDIK